MATSIPLNQANLAAINETVRRPAYARDRLAQSIMHIGVGGFHRAHQAVYLDDLLHDGDHYEWGICGVGLLPQDRQMRDAMKSQDCLYTLVERSAREDRARIVGSIANFRFAPDDSEAVLEALADPACRIVSLTITEGGYYQRSDGGFDAEHPDIVKDLASPTTPTCSFGFLAEALERRRVRGLAPFTLMSCDNVQHNGEVTRNTLLAYAELRSSALASWLREHGAFPNSMVDRITPATTDEHRTLVRDRFSIDDNWPVTAEPFLQWVLEDNFVNGRPQWERAGVQITSDVAPYERMKMRLLNASHQAMCHIGLLLGYEYAHQAMEDEQIRRLVRGMMDDEVTPLLVTPEGIDLERYKATLIERFANPTICDQLSRIATEGSARIPGFILPSIVEQLERSGSFARLAFTVACWFRCLTGTDDQGRSIPVIDPHRERLVEAAHRGGADPTTLLSLNDIFDESLSHSVTFTGEVDRALKCLYEKGSRQALAQYANS